MRHSIFKPLFSEEKGFTLIEMLTVIALMGIMVAIILPNVNNADENLKKNLFVSQFDSVFQKATKDARTLGETVEIEIQERSYQIYSAKPNRALDYPHGTELSSGDIDKRVIIDRKGMVQSPVTLNFEYSGEKYEVLIAQGYKNAFINGVSIEDWKVGDDS